MTDRNACSTWRDYWTLPDDVTYLNHGSFGPSPTPVRDTFHRWTEQLERQPMEFFLDEMEPALDDATATLADFVGTSRNNLVFVENSTFAMNIVVASTQLSPGDEVLVTDHEYGAVTRLWKRACQAASARVVTVALPVTIADFPDGSSGDDVASLITNAVLAATTDRTKLLVVSHVTSPTALKLPVEAICGAARERGIATCVDGPHAIAMLPVDLRRIDCDFYTASCHKWLSAPFGSGFLYVSPRQQKRVKPAIVSWGGSVGGRQPSWKDEFVWLGTRNPAAFLSVADAIRFFDAPASGFVASEPAEQSTLDAYRAHAASLVDLARQRVLELTQLEPPFHSSLTAGVTMTALPMPPSDVEVTHGKRDPLQDALRDGFQIETPIVRWRDHRFIRVSAHLYNSTDDVTRLADTLRKFQRDDSL
ncbi:aminotransferase class V-fold PLP-dependent enzyme [bacterium]|nr:aminotransferase class V-fold PLP-dependent enzyme [bacterium]